MSGPLDGYRVVELTSTVSGPFAGMMMADQGADVIKVEPPLIGDLARVMGSSRDGMAAMFSVINRNKRCIVLDFKEPKDFDVLKKLLDTADVLLENYRPGVVKKLGIDYETLKKTNPNINLDSLLTDGYFDKLYGVCNQILDISYIREYFLVKDIRVTIDKKIKAFSIFNKNFFSCSKRNL